MDEVKTVVFAEDGRALEARINRRDRVVTISEILDGDRNTVSITTASFSELVSIFLMLYENRDLDAPIAYRVS
jgi:hypothetical protein